MDMDKLHIWAHAAETSFCDLNRKFQLNLKIQYQRFSAVDLSIYITFEPCYLSLDSAFKFFCTYWLSRGGGLPRHGCWTIQSYKVKEDFKPHIESP